MKMKALATAITVSMPLLFSAAYAQTTTTPQSGNNRSAEGGAMTTNQSPAATGSSSQQGSTGASGGATGTSSTTGATGGSSTATGAASSNSGSSTDATTGRDARNMPGAATGAATGAAAGDAAASTEAITGWSVKDDIVGKAVYNENDEKIGDINDVVISTDGRTMYLLVGAGGFLGMGEKNVAVPFDRFKRNDDRVLLAGYSKEQLKALPDVKTSR